MKRQGYTQEPGQIVKRNEWIQIHDISKFNLKSLLSALIKQY